MAQANGSDTTRRGFLAATMISGMVNGSDAGLMNSLDDRYAAALAEFGSDGRAILEKALKRDDYRGRIEVSDAAALMKAERLSSDALMGKLIGIAKSFAHPPLSNYFVGAVVLGSSGNLYLGCNIEIPGNMLGLATHAEQAAIANAYMLDESGVEAITAGAAPCGHCRQFLSEVSLEMQMRVIMREGPSYRLAELLPHAFGPKNLGFKQGSFPVKRVHLATVSNFNDALVTAAWKAASTSYAPYSRSPSGVALQTTMGRIFAGSYIENAAFNPSLPPLEAALAGYFAAKRYAGDIERAVLVEGEKSAISHEVTTRSALMALSPKSRLDIYQVRSS